MCNQVLRSARLRLRPPLTPFHYAHYHFQLPQPTRIAATTCSEKTTFDTYLRIYDSCPGGLGYPTQIATGNDVGVQEADDVFICSYLFFDVHGTYYVVAVLYVVLVRTIVTPVRAGPQPS